MKVMKGMVVGALISASVMMMYLDTDNINKKKMMKKGKQLVKKMGIS